MSVSVLKSKSLILDNYTFNKNDLQEVLKNEAYIKIKPLKNGVRCDVENPSKESYVVIQQDGKINKSITPLLDDTGSYFLPSINGTLVIVRGINVRNYGDRLSNRWATNPTFATSIPTIEPDKTELTTKPSFTVTVQDVTPDPVESSVVVTFATSIPTIEPDKVELSTKPSFAVSVKEIVPDKTETPNNITFKSQEISK